MATTIDALGLAEDFEKAGFPRDQALGMARAIRDHSHETWRPRPTCTSSSCAWRSASRSSSIEQKIADVQIGLIKWFTGIMIAQAAAIVALVKLLPGPS